MDAARPGFTARLKTALTGDAGASLVYLGNVEVEQFWAVGEVGLPRASFDTTRRVVNRMDELAIVLAGAGDHVALKAAPEPELLELLAGLGLPHPRIVAAAGSQADRTVTEDLLADPAALATLSELASEGAYLLPHGMSTWEEQLAERTGLTPALPSAAISKAVNSKVYSRRLAEELGLRQPTGWAVTTLSELEAAVRAARPLLAAGQRVGVKDAFGVSGKGIVVVTDPARLDRLHRMVVAQARRAGTDRVNLVVEAWVDKGIDLNYQFTVGRDGTVTFDAVKELLTDRGVHRGHLMPARLPAATVAAIERAAAALGARLAADGYYGVVGVDAMTDPEGGLYPVVEINARNNMSTYQATLYERLVGPGQVALARHYPLQLTEPLPLHRIRSTLEPLLLDHPGGTGLVIMASATVNAAAGRGADSFPGRLYGLVVAGSHDELDGLDTEIAGRLAAREKGKSTVDDVYRIQGLPVTELAERYGTPLYVYDGAELRQRYQRLRDRLHPALEIFYSLKANPNVSVCALLRGLGARAEVSSLVELLTARQAGVSPADIIFLGPGKSERELAAALDEDIHAIVAESVGELALIDALARSRGRPAPVALRVNPDFAVARSGLTMGGRPRQFGIDAAQLLDEPDLVRRFPHLRFMGVHAYLGTRILDAATVVDNVTRVLELAPRLAERLGFPLELVDVGGGLGVAYFDTESDLDEVALAAGLNPVLAAFAQRYPQTRLILELGRYLAATSGVYVARIRYVKTSMGERFAVTDGGTNHHMAATGTGSFVQRNFPIRLLNRAGDGPAERWQLCGPLCTPNDTIGKNVSLPPLRPGDLIGILRSGAYGPSASPGLFLSHGFPAEVLVDDGVPHLVRDRDEPADLLRPQHRYDLLAVPDAVG